MTIQKYLQYLPAEDRKKQWMHIMKNTIGRHIPQIFIEAFLRRHISIRKIIREVILTLELCYSI